MPVIHVYHHSRPREGPTSLTRVCEDVAEAIGVPVERTWLVWHELDRASVHRPDWARDAQAGPIVRIFCRRSHAAHKVRASMHTIRKSLSEEVGCAESSVFVQVIRVDDEDVFNVGE